MEITQYHHHQRILARSLTLVCVCVCVYWGLGGRLDILCAINFASLNILLPLKNCRGVIDQLNDWLPTGNSCWTINCEHLEYKPTEWMYVMYIIIHERQTTYVYSLHQLPVHFHYRRSNTSALKCSVQGISTIHSNGVSFKWHTWSNITLPELSTGILDSCVSWVLSLTHTHTHKATGTITLSALIVEAFPQTSSWISQNYNSGNRSVILYWTSSLFHYHRHHHHQPNIYHSRTARKPNSQKM